MSSEKYRKAWHQDTTTWYMRQKNAFHKHKALVCIATLLFITTFVVLSSWHSSSPVETSHKSHAHDAAHIDWSLHPRATVRGVLVSLVQEDEMYDLRATMYDVEDRFNSKAGYPWVILSEQSLTPTFKEWVRAATDAPVYFGKIPDEHWYEPEWIDEREQEEGMLYQMVHGVYHGDSFAWRRATRYNVGYLADHPLLQDAEFYWKVQPRSRYLCNLDGDPFQYMKNNNKKMAFAMSMHENVDAIPSLWHTVQSYIQTHNSSVLPTSRTMYPGLVYNRNPTQGEYSGEYNTCHFWNNFMIMSLDFMRSKEYRSFFTYLDRAGGFFYERWGDAPVQTIAAALFLDKKEIYFMENVGYFFSVATACPTQLSVVDKLQCICDPDKSFVNHEASCTKHMLSWL